MIGARTSRWNIGIPILVTVIIGLVYWPVLRWMVNSWVASDYYSHGFLVPVVAGFFIWTERDQLKNRESSPIGIIWLILGASLYVASLVWQVRALGAVSLICVIAGLVCYIFGLRTFKALLFPLGFLIFMVPFWFVQNLAYELQFLSVHWSAGIAAILGLPITTTGVDLHLGNNITFTVGLVCSGINTLVALIALAAVYAHILKGPPAKRIGLFILAFPVAVGANILRIVSIILVAYFVNVATATGWYHDLSSPLFFFLAFGVLILSGWLLKLRLNYAKFGRQ